MRWLSREVRVPVWTLTASLVVVVGGWVWTVVAYEHAIDHLTGR